jgi:hypothetical protein
VARERPAARAHPRAESVRRPRRQERPALRRDRALRPEPRRARLRGDHGPGPLLRGRARGGARARALRVHREGPER